MLSWVLFIFHKALMVLIGYSSVLIILNKYKWWHIILVSGFLTTQAIFGMCIVTWLEGVVRASDGFITPSNDFILYGIIGEPWTVLCRVVFLIVGIGLIYLMINKKHQ